MANLRDLAKKLEEIWKSAAGGVANVQRTIQQPQQVVTKQVAKIAPFVRTATAALNDNTGWYRQGRFSPLQQIGDFSYKGGPTVKQAFNKLPQQASQEWGQGTIVKNNPILQKFAPSVIKPLAATVKYTVGPYMNANAKGITTFSRPTSTFEKISDLTGMVGANTPKYAVNNLISGPLMGTFKIGENLVSGKPITQDLGKSIIEGTDMNYKLGPLSELAGLVLKPAFTKLSTYSKFLTDTKLPISTYIKLAQNAVNPEIKKEIYKIATTKFGMNVFKAAVEGSVGFGAYGAIMPANSSQERVQNIISNAGQGALMSGGMKVTGTGIDIGWNNVVKPKINSSLNPTQADLIKQRGAINLGEIVPEKIKKPLDTTNPYHNDVNTAVKMLNDQNALRYTKALDRANKLIAEYEPVQEQFKTLPRGYDKLTPEQQQIRSKYLNLKKDYEWAKNFSNHWSGNSTITGKPRLQDLAELTPKKIGDYTTQYVKEVKKYISQGYDIPETVAQRFPELKTAFNARARYEKGLHTSFANKSAAVNEATKQDYGFKVKRQDGNAIPDNQIKKITTAAHEFENAVGPVKDIVDKLDLTIAHTNGKYPFLRNDASGLYSNSDRTITVGMDDIKAFAHEMAHALDAASGSMTKHEGKYGSTVKKGNYEVDGMNVADLARQSMNGSKYEVARLMKTGNDLTPAQKEAAALLKARIGKYFNEEEEVFARLIEQYVSTKNAGSNLVGSGSEISEGVSYYHDAPAYWSKENFDKLMPLIQRLLNQKISNTRQALDLKTPQSFGGIYQYEKPTVGLSSEPIAKPEGILKSTETVKTSIDIANEKRALQETVSVERGKMAKQMGLVDPTTKGNNISQKDINDWNVGITKINGILDKKYNSQGNPKLEPLFQEARKYKTAEEFLNAVQPKDNLSKMFEDLQAKSKTPIKVPTEESFNTLLKKSDPQRYQNIINAEKESNRLVDLMDKTKRDITGTDIRQIYSNSPGLENTVINLHKQVSQLGEVNNPLDNLSGKPNEVKPNTLRLQPPQTTLSQKSPEYPRLSSSNPPNPPTIHDPLIDTLERKSGALKQTLKEGSYPNDTTNYSQNLNDNPYGVTQADINEYSQSKKIAQKTANRERLQAEIGIDTINSKRLEGLKTVTNLPETVTIYRGTASPNEVFKYGDYVTKSKSEASQLGYLNSATIKSKDLSYNKSGDLIYTPQTKPNGSIKITSKGKDGIVPEWSTQNQYYLNNPFRRQLDEMVRTNKFDKEVIANANRWEMRQVLNDKPAYLSDNIIPENEIFKFASDNKLVVGRMPDGTVVVAKGPKELKRVLTSTDQKNLGLSLGYKDLTPTTVEKTATQDFLESPPNFIAKRKAGSASNLPTQDNPLLYPWDEPGYVEKFKTVFGGDNPIKKEKITDVTFEEADTAKNIALLKVEEDKSAFEKIFAKWIGKSQSAKTISTLVSEKFTKIPKETALDVIKAREGNNNVSPEAQQYARELKKVYDNAFDEVRKVNPDTNYLENYVTHIWKESPTQVQQAYTTAKQKFKFAVERKLPTYEEGIRIGLTPKYNNPAQILEEYVFRLEKVKANIQLFKDLRSEGLLVQGGAGAGDPNFASVEVPGFPQAKVRIGEGTIVSGWYAPRKIATKINNIFNPADYGLTGKIAKITGKASSIIQDITMSGGLPKTPLNAWTFAQATKEILAGRVKSPLVSFFRSMSSTASNKFFKENSKQIIKMQERNIPVSTTYSVENLIDKGTVKNIFGEGLRQNWDKLMNEPTFQRFMPQLQIGFFNDIEAQALKRGMGPAEASDIAAKATKNFYGIISSGKEAQRSTFGKDLTRAVLFAPKYRETMINFWINDLKALKNPLALENQANTKFIVGAVITYIGMNAINKANTGKDMWNNPSGKEMTMLIKTKDGYIGVPFLSSIATVPRTIFSMAKKASEGDLTGATLQGKGFLSSAIRPPLDLLTNQNYYGGQITDPANPQWGDRALYMVGQYNHPYIQAGLNVVGQNLPKDWKSKLGITSQQEPLYQTASKALEMPFRFYNNKPGQDAMQTAYYFDDRDTVTKTLDANSLNMWNVLHPQTTNGRQVTNNILNSQQKAVIMLNNPQVQQAEYMLAVAQQQRGEVVDPIWNLTPTQRQLVFASRVQLPGQKNTYDTYLSAQPWYKPYLDQQSKFYDSLPASTTPTIPGQMAYPEPDSYTQSQMDLKNWKDPSVQAWFAARDQYNNQQLLGLGLGLPSLTSGYASSAKKLKKFTLGKAKSTPNLKISLSKSPSLKTPKIKKLKMTVFKTSKGYKKITIGKSKKIAISKSNLKIPKIVIKKALA